jgi:voltage-gated potassium channel
VNNKSKIVTILFMLLGVTMVGVSGYMLLLNVDFVDALYMTVITISTVGFGEVGVMTETAKLFTILIIFSGITVVGYGVTSLVASVFEGEWKAAWRRKRMNAKIQELHDHYIVCGAGDVGRTVIKSLLEKKADFIVIEENEQRAEELEKEGVPTVRGDATHEDVLLRAGIRAAKGIVCTLATDSENVFTVLTARQMNEQIYIVAKAVEPSAHNKLVKAGANNTISPSEIGGQRIATLLMRPLVISFLDVITRAGDVTLDLEEVCIPQTSALNGRTLADVRIPERTGLVVLALKRRDKETFRFNPGSGEVLNHGDTMVVLGTPQQAAGLADMVNR